MAIPETVTELLEPVVATLDVELIDVEWNGNSLRVVVDRLWGPDEVVDKTNGITTQQLADVNRLISPILDQHDPIPGRYTLEVSSPGVERKLTRTEHFQRAIGEQVIVKMMPKIEPRRVKGELLSIDDAGTTIEVLGEEIDGIEQDTPSPVTLEIAFVQKARTSFDWGPAPKPGKPKAGAKKSPSKQAQLNSPQLKSKEKDPS